MKIEIPDELMDSIKKQIAEYEKENQKPKDVIDYDGGYVIANGEIDKTDIVSEYEVDCLYSIGLYCGTEEEAEKLLRKMQIEHRLKQWAKMCDEKVDWSSENCKDKYYVCYSVRGDGLVIDSHRLYKSSNVYFTDRSMLERAIEDIGEQN